MITLAENKKSRCIRFMESLESKINQMLATGHYTDHGRGKPNEIRKAEIENEMDIAIDLIRQGKSATQAGAAIGISGNTLHRRLHSRGLTIKEIRA